MHAAFHPESRTSQEQDKCHQLTNAINHLNKAAKRTFIPRKEMSFNEGGIPSKSNYNPVRQYNNSKPDKYRINFFILANGSSGHNFIYHIDVYQGKNKQNIGIAEDLWNLPMTQQAVTNAIFSTGLYTDPNGFCELYMDYHYSAFELFVMLTPKYKILACGTARKNRRGLDTYVINLSISVTRGESKRFYNLRNGIVCGKWKDNKVVFISSLPFVGNGTTIQQCGSKKVPFTCPKALQAYNKHMGYVVLVDFDKKIGGL